MTDDIISLRIDKNIRDKMKRYTHINWSALLRKALLEELHKMHRIDRARALKALHAADTIRKSGAYNSERTGAEIIREWRDKRR